MFLTTNAVNLWRLATLILHPFWLSLEFSAGRLVGYQWSRNNIEGEDSIANWPFKKKKYPVPSAFNSGDVVQKTKLSRTGS